MRIAYLLPVHTRPSQVMRLLRRLETKTTTFVVHVDRKTSDADQDAIMRGAAGVANVTFLDRHSCYWGGFGVVRALLAGIGHLVERRVPFDYAALLSGQDYPLRSNREIEEKLTSADDRSFLEFFALPRDGGWGPTGGLDRIEKWHVIWRFALHLRLPWRRRIPGGLRPYGGERTCFLARPVIEYVHHFVKDNPDVVRFFEHALHPSELFFQTVIMNSPYADSVVDDPLTHIEWRGGSSPAIFQVGDFEHLVSSGKLFARKFDVEVDSAILDLLDAHIDRVGSSTTG